MPDPKEKAHPNGMQWFSVLSVMLMLYHKPSSSIPVRHKQFTGNIRNIPTLKSATCDDAIVDVISSIYACSDMAQA